MPGWNYAEIWETVASAIPDAPAQIQGSTSYTWREFDERANGVAHVLLEAGAQEQDKVAQYLYNCPEYLESMYAPGRPAWCRSTPTTATPTTSSSTCGTTPTPWPWSSTAPSPRPSSASSTGCPG